MPTLETERLALRPLTLDDAEFILALLNDPSFIRQIGDRGIRTLEGARDYLRNKPLASYAQHGVGMYLTSLRADGTPVGICGLFKRDAHPDFELGFAFMTPFQQKGYAVEASRAAIEEGRSKFGAKRIVAVTDRVNTGSLKVLEKLGLRFEKTFHLPGDPEELQLFARDY